MTHANLDAWITGNYGEDHPDNQQHPHEAEAARIERAHSKYAKSAYDRWIEERYATTKDEEE